MLDHVLVDMGTRFGIHQQRSMMLSSLIPASVTNKTFEELQPAIDKCDIFLPDETTVKASSGFSNHGKHVCNSFFVCVLYHLVGQIRLRWISNFFMKVLDNQMFVKPFWLYSNI